MHRASWHRFARITHTTDRGSDQVPGSLYDRPPPATPTVVRIAGKREVKPQAVGRAVTIPRPPGAPSSPADEFRFEEQFFEINGHVLDLVHQQGAAWRGATARP